MTYRVSRRPLFGVRGEPASPTRPHSKGRFAFNGRIAIKERTSKWTSWFISILAPFLAVTSPANFAGQRRVCRGRWKRRQPEWVGHSNLGPATNLDRQKPKVAAEHTAATQAGASVGRASTHSFIGGSL